MFYRLWVWIQLPDCSKLAINWKNDNHTSIYWYDVIVNFFWGCFVSFVKFSYWFKFHPNIITGSRVMTIYFHKGLTRNPEMGNTRFLVLPNILRMGQVRNTKFGTDVSNKMLLNAAKCQGYNVFRFWVFKRKPTRKGFIVSDHIDEHWKTHILCPWYTKIKTFRLFPLHGKLSPLSLSVPKWFSAVYITIIYCHVVIINKKNWLLTH